jgi:hypothetical protein
MCGREILYGKPASPGYNAVMRVRRILAYIWAGPTTCVGLVFVALGLISGGQARVVDGVLEAEGGLVEVFLRRVVGIWLAGGASAMTLGHVVIARDRQSHDRTRAHERVHVRQCERWGPLFLPAYLSASLAMFLMRRKAYRDNPFEREAFSKAGPFTRN